MNAQTVPIQMNPLAAIHSPAGQANNAPLTRVSLAHVDGRIDLSLRFGTPCRMLRLDRWRRCAVFAEASIFCRVRWEGNEHGTTRLQLLVAQACMPLDVLQRIPGIRPGARILLHAESETEAKAVLSHIEAIEALGIELSGIPCAYWRTLAHRMSAQLPLPDCTVEQHAACKAGKALQ